jgi:site-specific recombinase XerD
MRLQLLIEQYIAYRRSLGEQQRSNGCTLRAFGHFIGDDTTIADVSLERVEAFLPGKGPITLSWYSKLSVLRQFYKYAVSRGYTANAPLPIVLPKLPPAFVPYIYSPNELEKLVHTAKNYDHICLAPETIQMILIVLYGMGLRLLELINLDRTHVNLTDSLITVHQGKFGKTRLLPIGSQLQRALQGYISRRPTSPANTPFFTNRAGGRIKPSTLQHNYRKLCCRAQISRSDGGRYQPRLHDLRHTFAVHRLTSWYRQGADVQKLLPQLSAYLGHVNIQATQVYLTMTPELLQQAGNRFEQYVMEENLHV